MVDHNHRLLIDNDGTRPPLALTASARFTRGVYFQDPAHMLALVLSVRPDDFLPRAVDGVWTAGHLSALKRAENW